MVNVYKCRDIYHTPTIHGYLRLQTFLRFNPPVGNRLLPGWHVVFSCSSSSQVLWKLPVTLDVGWTCWTTWFICGVYKYTWENQHINPKDWQVYSKSLGDVGFLLFFKGCLAEQVYLGGGNSNVFFFLCWSLFGEDEPILTNIFQMALKPPTSIFRDGGSLTQLYIFRDSFTSHLI